MSYAETIVLRLTPFSFASLRSEGNRVPSSYSTPRFAFRPLQNGPAVVNNRGRLLEVHRGHAVR